MTLLRFDPAGLLDARDGMTPSQLESVVESLEQIRREIVTADESNFPPDLRFFALPEHQLTAYEQERERSPLGRVFKIANGLHDHLDSVVVLGKGVSLAGVEAIMKASCDPYHNELSRAARGSKPRMYFDGDQFNNDATASLIQRLRGGGESDTDADSRFAIVVLDDCGEVTPPASTLPYLHAALKSCLGPDAETWLPRLVIPISHAAKGRPAEAGHLVCKEVISIPEGVCGGFDVLAPVGLLPAAFLGLDCIQLLVGAAGINEHFKTADFDDNIVMQYAAVHYGLSHYAGKSLRVLNVWSRALQPVGVWYQQLFSGSRWGGSNPLTTITRLASWDAQSDRQSCLYGRTDTVVNDLIVEKDRCDPLRVGRLGGSNEPPHGPPMETFRDAMLASVKQSDQMLSHRGQTATKLLIPEINAHTLGQLFQMLMISSVIEKRLATKHHVPHAQKP